MTGVAVFIGSKVCKELQRNKFSIIGIDDLSSGKKKTSIGGEPPSWPLRKEGREVVLKLKRRVL